jgi:hypothetical protein
MTAPPALDSADRLLVDAVLTKIIATIERHRPRGVDTVAAVLAWLDRALAVAATDAEGLDMG